VKLVTTFSSQRENSGEGGAVFLIRRYVDLGRTERAEVEQAQAESGYRGELSLLPAAKLQNNQSDPPRKNQEGSCCETCDNCLKPA
jgi:hypothetical protein